MEIAKYIDQFAATLHPLAKENFRPMDKLFLMYAFERCGLQAFPEVTGPADGERCSGEMVCERCGEKYYHHPLDWRLIEHGKKPYLNVLCDGRRVKL